jgi:hypothetical protein
MACVAQSTLYLAGAAAALQAMRVRAARRSSHVVEPDVPATDEPETDQTVGVRLSGRHLKTMPR